MTRTRRLVALIVGTVLALGMWSGVAHADEYDAASCIDDIAIVLDYEAEYNDADAEDYAAGMDYKCLRLGGKAERKRDRLMANGWDYYDAVEVGGPLLTYIIKNVARAYRVSQYDMMVAYDELYG